MPGKSQHDCGVNFFRILNFGTADTACPNGTNVRRYARSAELEPRIGVRAPDGDGSGSLPNAAMRVVPLELLVKRGALDAQDFGRPRHVPVRAFQRGK